MARPLRFEYPGAFYHVMNRGANHNRIFIDPNADRELFIGSLADSIKRMKIKLHAYSLMDNHYHLLIETPLGNLSRAMRHIDGVYTQRFNRLHGRDGALLRGRFKSKLVQNGPYFLELIRYIHLNGVRAHAFSSPLDDQYCSHPFYMRAAKAPFWLSTELALSYFQRNGQPPQVGLNQFIHAGIPEKTAQILNRSHWPAIFGDDNFIEEIRLKFINEEDPHPDKPQERELIQIRQPSGNRIIETFCQWKNCAKASVLARTTSENKLNRTLIIVLLRRVSLMTYREIGELLGGISYGAVAKVCRQYEKSYEGQVKQFEQRLKAES